MLRKTRKTMFFSVLLVVLLSMMSFSVSAMAPSEYEQNDTVISPRGTCQYCGIGGTFGVCLRESNYQYSSTHGYGFLWQNSCYYEAYSSHMVYRCNMCGRVEYVGGQHDCLETHRDCGLGAYVVCFFGR